MSEEPTKPKKSGCARAGCIAALVVLALLVAAPTVAFLRGGLTADRVLDFASGYLKRSFPKLTSEQLTGVFTTGIPKVIGSNGDVLEVATARSDEVFVGQDVKTFGGIYMGTTTAEIRVPVTYRYHIKLSEPWKLASKDQVCLVLAPELRPSLPPAIHTSEIEKKTARGWALFNEKALLEHLEKGMTAALNKRAADPAHLDLVREASRESVAEFVKTWLLREDQWRSDAFTSIIVVFPDELTEDLELQLEGLSDHEATVKLGE